ncbi:tRNA splicing endonuclease 2 homolog (SEN2, S. cerevisiae), isoform CRA_b, partial [Mus musculus]
GAQRTWSSCMGRVTLERGFFPEAVQTSQSPTPRWLPDGKVRVEWARDFLRRQGHDESTVQKILTDYTEPLELPCREEKEETPQHEPLSSKADSSLEGRVEKDELP